MRTIFFKFSTAPKLLGGSLLVCALACFSTGCQSAVDYVCESGIRGEMERNKENLTKLRVGMTKDEVRAIMGAPLENESFNKPDVWYYYERPRWQDGVATRDECTPLVFDEDGLLAGWGKEYYKTKYEFNTSSPALPDAR